MKYVFIINPAAGAKTAEDLVISSVKNAGITAEVYVTKAPGDATEYVSNYIREYGDDVGFIACGGDGTLSEVANGAVGSNAAVGCFPCGSGNDFIKYYGTEHFLGISSEIDASTVPIDLMKVGDRYAINAVHFGFDTHVLRTMLKVRRKPIIGGKHAYTTGVVCSLFNGMRNKCRIEVDGEELDTGGEITLCTIANGAYVGGKYKCAPRSSNSDGMLEVCVAKKVSIPSFVRLVGKYERGEHLDNDKFKNIIVYRRGKSVRITAPEGFEYSRDGELTRCNDFTVEAVHNAVNFLVPKTVSQQISHDKHAELGM